MELLLNRNSPLALKQFDIPPAKLLPNFLTFVANGYKDVRNAASPIADTIRMTNDNAKKVGPLTH